VQKKNSIATSDQNTLPRTFSATPTYIAPVVLSKLYSFEFLNDDAFYAQLPTWEDLLNSLTGHIEKSDKDVLDNVIKAFNSDRTV